MRLDTMLEIEKQVELFNKLDLVEESLKNIAEQVSSKDITKVLIVGCGDSYFAGLAVKSFVSKELGVTCLAMTALEFEAYAVESVDEKTLIIAISMSGNVARTVSGVLKAQEKGAFVIGMTNSTSGKLYVISKYPFYLGLEEESGWTPGTLTYTGSVFYLINLIISLSNNSKEEYLPSLHAIKDFLNQNWSKLNEVAKEVAKNLYVSQSDFPGYVLGGGPNYATAKYGAAKFLELCDVMAVGQETEEFAHQEFWIINKNNPVFLLAQDGASISRSYEVAEALRYYGLDLVVITSDIRFEQISKYMFLMPENINDYMSPLLYQIPLQLVAYHYSMMKGFDPDNRTHMDPFRKKVSRLLTRGNKNAGY